MAIEQHGEFDFPKFKTERERIKHYSKLYKNKTIIESFADFYQDPSILKMSVGLSDKFTLSTVNLGSNVRVKFDNTTKGKVNIISNNPKEYFSTKHNVWTWANFDSDLWYDANIIEKKPDGYMVDILLPMKDDFINNIKKTTRNNFQSSTVTVKNLQVQRGGYIGKINIDSITKITGQPYEVDAFIPGSMITLNIEKDFSKWNNTNVEAMVIKVSENNGKMSVICSRKKLLNSQGQTSLINLYDTVFRDGGTFDQVFDGVVTGVINSNRKKGVFVEISEYSITGLINIDPSELVNYRVGDNIKVLISGVEWDESKEPYQRTWDGIIYECNLKPTLVEVK